MCTATRNFLFFGVVLILLGCCLVLLLDNPNVAKADQIVWEFFLHSRTPAATSFWGTITLAFNPTIATIESAILGGFLWLGTRQWRNGAYIVVVMLVSTAITHILKPVIARSRPPEVHRLITETNWSWPSGHATAVAALCTALALFAATRHLSRWLTLLLIALAVILIILIMVSRLYLGVHWLSDVLAGACIGSGCAFAFACLLTPPSPH